MLVASTDGVGTKLKLAIALERYDTIGVDLVHHCVNDIAVQGADPLFFLDYLAVGQLRAEVAAEIVTGIANACAAAGIALVGGETAELPDLYRGDDFDLAGFIVGVVARGRRDRRHGRARGRRAARAAVERAAHQRLLAGAPRLRPRTTGHAPRRAWSGRSARRCSSRIGPTSTRSGSCAARCAARAATSLAFAHITGGGWVDNIPRTLPAGLGVAVELGSWPVPLIFSLIQERGDIADDEMVRTFNLGIGLTCVVHPEHGEAALRRPRRRRAASARW